jgi:hypothetical protein
MSSTKMYVKPKHKQANKSASQQVSKQVSGVGDTQIKNQQIQTFKNPKIPKSKIQTNEKSTFPIYTI